MNPLDVVIFGTIGAMQVALAVAGWSYYRDAKRLRESTHDSEENVNE